MEQKTSFPKERFYQIGLVLLAMGILGVWVAKSLSESKLTTINTTQKAEQLAAIEALQSEQLTAIETLKQAQEAKLQEHTEESLAVLATALSGYSVPKADKDLNRLHVVLDTFVKHKNVNLAILTDEDGNVVASSDRYFEEKALNKKMAQDISNADTRGLVRTETGWLIVARLTDRGQLILRYDTRQQE